MFHKRGCGLADLQTTLHIAEEQDAKGFSEEVEMVLYEVGEDATRGKMSQCFVEVLPAELQQFFLPSDCWDAFEAIEKLHW